MIRIACLHTADSNVAVMEAAALAFTDVGLVLEHVVRADLLREVEAGGGLTDELRVKGSQIVDDLLLRNDAVIITCSSLGALADGRRVQRSDLALAERAVARGGVACVLYTSPTTLVPTTELFAAAATKTGAHVDLRFVEGAWPLFRSGDMAGYFGLIAEGAERALRSGADVVALAQVSMSGAAALVPDFEGRILTAPQVALAAALNRS